MIERSTNFSCNGRQVRNQFLQKVFYSSNEMQ